MTPASTIILNAIAFVIAECGNEARHDNYSHELKMKRFTRSSVVSLEKGEYCAMFRLNYEHYCQGIWTGEKLLSHSRYFDRIKKFCPTYKRICVHAKSGSKRKYKKRPQQDRSDLEEEPREMSTEEILEELAELIPCTPECSPSIHPHCTQECKCDYDYPRMQRFCNPPPLPLFLNPCRLWYWSCPKYSQYHYASQYIYSKAEKGKKWLGPQMTNPNPFNIPSPADFSRMYQQRSTLPDNLSEENS